MRPPEGNIASYLVAFEAALRVGLARREQIVAEVDDHLHQAAAEATAKGMKLSEAERQAIARFGSPEEAAARFGRDFLAVLHGRLFTVAACFDRWRPDHPWAGTLVLFSPLLIAYGVVAAVLGSALDLLRYSLGLWTVYLALALRARGVATRPEEGFRARARSWDVEHAWGMALVRASAPVGLALGALAAGKGGLGWVGFAAANVVLQLVLALDRPRRPRGTDRAATPAVADEILPPSGTSGPRCSRVALAGIAAAFSLLILMVVVRPEWSEASWLSISALPWVALIVLLPPNVPLRRWLGRHPLAGAALILGPFVPMALTMFVILDHHSRKDLGLLIPGFIGFFVVVILISGTRFAIHQQERLRRRLRADAEQQGGLGL